MKLISIHAPQIHAGKSLVSNLLLSQLLKAKKTAAHLECSSLIIKELADILKRPERDIIKDKELYRDVLIWLGQKYLNQTSEFVTEHLQRRIAMAQNDGYEFYIISGLRRASQFKLIEEHGGLMIEVRRPNSTNDVAMDVHAMKNHIIIENTSTINALDAKIEALMRLIL